jgi:hypothetical protein
MKKQPINIEKLILIRDNLINNVTKEHFDMNRFTNVIGEKCECGSQVCIIGHSIKLDLKNFKKHKKETFKQIGINKWTVNRTYYEWSLKFLEIDEKKNEKLWDYLFSEDWSKYDNTIEGAVKRINYVIENKTYNKIELNQLQRFIDEN